MTAPDRIQITHQPRTMSTLTIRAALDIFQQAANRGTAVYLSPELVQELRAALKAEPEGEGPRLQWTDNMPPSEACRYDHCIAETPFGRFLITWKSWKEYDSPTVDETPWGDWYAAFNSVDDAKAACQQGMNERLTRCGTPATPPDPTPKDAPGPTFLDAIRLAQGCHDCSGGHSGTEGEAWHGAIDTVVDVLKRAAVGPWDSQLTAVYGVGVEAQAGDVEELGPVAECPHCGYEGEMVPAPQAGEVEA
jgi:hypothetical protein